MKFNWIKPDMGIYEDMPVAISLFLLHLVVMLTMMTDCDCHSVNVICQT